MLQFERQEAILRILEDKKNASIRELAAQLFTSEASIRRDIEVLEQQGLVKRVYGGVLLSRYENEVVPVRLRDSDHSAVKEEIARRAAAMIQDGDTIIMDASSTVRRVLKYITHRRNLKIITNNLRIFSDYTGNNIQLYCTGGTYSAGNHAFTGPSAENYLRTISADYLFFSSQGITADGIISDVSEEETALRRVMIARTAKQFFLCDSSKIGLQKLFTLCNKDDITGVICDARLPWEEE
ncbi:MAG: DeoR/GlpR transcriptional regulator [Clostridia bacterium]|nr:DeoR/GlpR transcriptional regulator [Clostridia bacterium]